MKKTIKFCLLICTIFIASIVVNFQSSAQAATTNVQTTVDGKKVYFHNAQSALYKGLNEGIAYKLKVQDNKTKKWISLEKATIVKLTASKDFYFAKKADADQFIKEYKKNNIVTLTKVSYQKIQQAAQNQYKKEAPSIVLNANKDDKTVTITATVKDNGKVTLKRWAKGKKSAQQFTKQDKALEGNKFTVTENGLYTVYAIDNDGNKRTKVIRVTSINESAPEISLTVNDTDTTTVSKKVEFIVTDEDGVKDQKWAYGDHDATYFADKGSRIAPMQKNKEHEANKIIALQNGVYTFFVEDTLGNKTIEKVTIDGLKEYTEVHEEGVQCEVCRMDIHNTDPNKVYTTKAVDDQGYTHYFCRVGCIYHQEHSNGVEYKDKQVRDYGAAAPRNNNWISLENAVTVKFKADETAKGIMGWKVFHFKDITSAANYLGTTTDKVVPEKLDSIKEYTKTNHRGMDFQYEVDKAVK